MSHYHSYKDSMKILSIMMYLIDPLSLYLLSSVCVILEYFVVYCLSVNYVPLNYLQVSHHPLSMLNTRIGHSGKITQWVASLEQSYLHIIPYGEVCIK